MTVCALNTNILSLTLYKSNLEYSIMNISSQRQNIAYTLSRACTGTTDFSNDPQVQSLQYMDSYLELQQKNLETQQKAATTQLESLQKLLENNIKKDFTINLSA